MLKDWFERVDSEKTGTITAPQLKVLLFQSPFCLFQFPKIPLSSLSFALRKKTTTFDPFPNSIRALSPSETSNSLSPSSSKWSGLSTLYVYYTYFYISIHIRMYCINWCMYCTVNVAGCTILTEMALWASMVTVFSNSLFWFSLIVWVLRKLVHDFVKFVFFCQNSLHLTSSFLRSEIPIYVYNSEI